jgi:predicted nucleic acid-binding protein
MPPVTADADLLLRALEVYELERLDFAEAYLVACAELTGTAAIASFGKAIDRVASVEQVAP